ncbi:MAG: calcineurin-like phosphoesterase family protein [Muribaculaceae bacterium]|nr:calcineurin-like phosphoesterase family protein [Muribaculaceae bacterium]
MKTIKLSTFIAFLGLAQTLSAGQLSGRVLSEGKPLAGVPVTDGTSIVTTDAKGRYAFEAAPDARYVYVTLPDGYQVPMSGGVPVLYADITPDKKGNFKHDFNLTPSGKDMTKHILFVMADPQVYFDPNMAEVEKAALEMKQTMATDYAGQEAVGIMVGDIVGQISQGEHFFPWMIKEIAKCDFPYFYCVGNHDIEMDVATNEESRKSFNHYFGPTYYSFNRGKIHYVVLDDVFWMGRYYAGYLPKQQLDWLKKDLALVPEGSTVIVSMHIPCYSREARHQQWGKESYHKVVSNRQALFNILKPYNAHIMTGHEHYNENYIFSDKLYEHCHAPLSTLFWCAPWAMDGTPGGYAVYEIDGDNINWYYKSVGRDKDYQIELYPRGRSREHPEAVVANIWNVDSSWKVEWLEDGVLKGNMTRYTGYDPNIWQDVSEHGKDYAFPYVGSDITEHMFYAVPESETSVITVRATDHNGNVYTRTINQSDYITNEN